MKVGSGGLQSMIGQEITPVKKIENIHDKKEQGGFVDVGIAKPSVLNNQLIKAVEQMNSSADLANRDIKFTMHEETNRILVKVLDQETGEVVKEFPPEEFLDMVARLKETVGVFVDKHV